MLAALSMAKSAIFTRCRWQGVRRQVVIWPTLLCFVLIAGGVPLPEAPTFGQGGAYPCQSHRCGCSSAEQCWKSCCCFSHSQKLAWAKQNNLTPPAIAIAQVRSQPAKVQSCCAAKASSASNSCCKASPASTNTSDWSLALEKAKCRGAATQWLTLGAALPAPELTVSDEEVPMVDRWSIVDEWTLSCADRPEAPPPRA